MDIPFARWYDHQQLAPPGKNWHCHGNPGKSMRGGRNSGRAHDSVPPQYDLPSAVRADEFRARCGRMPSSRKCAVVPRKNQGIGNLAMQLRQAAAVRTVFDWVRPCLCDRWFVGRGRCPCGEWSVSTFLRGSLP